MRMTTGSTSAEQLPDTFTALCSREQAARLIAFDHHRVRVRGHHCVMLTYHWMSRPLDEQQEPFMLTAVPRYADQHPPAPPPIQALVDQLSWK